jgi:type IV pilus assembly protein PilQ
MKSTPAPRHRPESIEIRSAHPQPPPSRSRRLVGSWPGEQLPRISLEAHQESVVEVVARLARFTRINLVLADGVSGQVTTRLREVPWTEALSAVCDLLDLVAVREGNVVQILRWEDWVRALPSPPDS